jgi:hypothetical protein
MRKVAALGRRVTIPYFSAWISFRDASIIGSVLPRMPLGRGPARWNLLAGDGVDTVLIHT